MPAVERMANSGSATELGLPYAVGVQSTLSVWVQGNGTIAAFATETEGPSSQVAEGPSTGGGERTGLRLTAGSMENRELAPGNAPKLRSSFAALRVRPVHRDYWRAELHAEEWLLIEWSKGKAEPVKYRLSTLPASLKLKDLVGPR